MATRILYEFISERRMTITDSIERCLKKGTSNDIVTSAVWYCNFAFKTFGILVRFVWKFLNVQIYFKFSLDLREKLTATPLTIRQRWGAASGSFFSLPAVYPAGLGHRERGGAQNLETHLQKHPGRWISQHTSQTGCEYLVLYCDDLCRYHGGMHSTGCERAVTLYLHLWGP